MSYRIYGDVSETHLNDFKFIKGVYGYDNNGDTLAKLIELALPHAHKKAAQRTGKARKG